MKSIVVTGAYGIIGSSVVEDLLNKGYKVYSLDNSANKPYSNENFIEEKVNFVVDREKIKLLMRKWAPDIFLHMAYTMNNDLPDILPIETAGDSVKIDEYIYKLMFTSGVKNIILLSTHQIYGPQKKDSVVTELEVENPVSLYGQMKLESEQALINATNLSSKGIGTILRLTPVYSFKFLDNIKACIFSENDGCPIIFGNGDYKFSLCNIKNIIEFIDGIIDNIGNKKFQGVFNISDENSYTANEIHEFFKTKGLMSVAIKKNKPGIFASAKNAESYKEVDPKSMVLNVIYRSNEARNKVKFKNKLND